MLPFDSYNNCLPGLVTESGLARNCHCLDRAMQVGEVLIKAENDLGPHPRTSLFFIELYRRTSDNKYLHLVEQELNLALQGYHKRYAANYSFDGGYMGTAFACLQFYKVTHREYYIQQALQIAESCTTHYLHELYATSSLLYGRAGVLMVLLHLHQQTGEAFLLQSINLFTKRIIWDLEVQKEGLAAGLTGQSIKSPLGLAAGTSGLAYIFLELGYYFRNETFFYLANQLFAYEKQYWDQERKCWPDLRKSIRDEHDLLVHRKHFEAGNYRFFTKPTLDFSISHGMAGMGIARARAFQLTNEAPYLDELNHCVDQVYNYYEKDGLFVLSEKSADAGLFLLEAYRVTKDIRFLQRAYRVTEQVERQVNEMEPSMGDGHSAEFYHGLTGLGYLYLQLTDPAGTCSAITPRLITCCKKPYDMAMYPLIAITTQGAIKTILQRSFTKTLYVLEQIAPQTLNDFLSVLSTGTTLGAFGEWVEHLLPGLEKKERVLLTEVYGIELAKNNLYDGIESGALLHMQEMYMQEAVNGLLALKSGTFLNQLLITTSGWEARECCFYQQLNNLYIELGDYDLDESPNAYIILKPTVKKEAGEELRVIEKLSALKINTSCVQEMVISCLDRELLHIFSAPISIRRAINQLAALVRKIGHPAFLEPVQEPLLTQYSRFLPCNPVVKPAELSLGNIEQVILEKIKSFLNFHILKPL